MVKPSPAAAAPPATTQYNNDGDRKPDSYRHPERFWVDYVVEAPTEDDARRIAWDTCLEQTVELPDRIDAVKDVMPYVVGSIERIERVHDRHGQREGSSPPQVLLWRVSVAYPNDTAGDELTQFVNVVFGNTSLKRGVAVENVTLSRSLSDNRCMFPGPKFGIRGLRDLLGVPNAPLLCTALKPMGKSSREFADMAYRLARGGIDIIKDDHGLADQVWSPFEERVTLCAAAVRRANDETGKRCLYAPCLNAPVQKLVERASYAKRAGAGAVMLLPGISGWDIVRELAQQSDFNLPILIHPAMLGGWLQTEDSGDDDDANKHYDSSIHHHSPHGFGHALLFGVFPRLCGGDAVIFPNAGGRFQFTKSECQAVAEGCRRPLGRFEPILPSPAGGMNLSRVDEMRKTFGDDTLFLIGGALLEQGPDLEEDARTFARSAGRDPTDRPQQARQNIATEAQEREAGAPSKRKLADQEAVSIAEVERVATAVRRRVLEYTLRNNGGYLSQACSSAETLATLYLRALRLGPSVSPSIPGPFRGSPSSLIETITGEGHNGDPTDPNLDRIIFSPVHYALVLYSLLVEVGRLDIAAFESYNIDGSTVELIGAEHSPGHAVTAGSLAQALSQGAGIAYARKLKGHTGRVVVYMSDGEFQEGQTWEAVQALVFHGIDNVTVVVDVNGQQCDGKMESVMDVGNLADKLRAFGANACEVDGHSVQDIELACKNHGKSKPTFVICRTDPCRGFPLLRKNAPKLHYVRFKNDAEKRQWEDILSRMDVKASGPSDSGSDDDKQHRLDTKRPRLDKTSASAPKTTLAEQRAKKPVEVNKPTHVTKAHMIETVTRPHRTNLVAWARSHPKAIILTADLTSSCEADLLRDTLPDQYLSLGMAEQNMMSFAGGLAREGYRPIIQTFGVFITRRPFDQVAMSIGVPNLPVKMLGFLPGVTTPGGVTHQAIDDVALMRCIPNVRVLECGDATEVESVLDAADEIPGPVYVRMLRGQVPRLFPKGDAMKFGVVRELSHGRDLVVVTSGICTEEALKASDVLSSAGVGITHLHLSTLVPFPSDTIVKAAKYSKHGIITMENHSVVGGIGSATAEALAEAGVGKPLLRLGVQGVYAHGASCEYLMAEYGLDAQALIEAVEKLIGKTMPKLGGRQADLAMERKVQQEALPVEQRPEDL